MMQTKVYGVWIRRDKYGRFQTLEKKMRKEKEWFC